MKRKGIIFCLIGPAGGGKTTVAQRLAQDPGITVNVSVTSRAPRPDESPGSCYHFVTREEFLRRVAAGEFFEWEEIHGNLYGTLRSSILSQIEQGRDLLLTIDIQGSLNYKRHFRETAVLVFLAPPSPEALRSRLENRSGSAPDDVQRRIATARQEYDRLLSLHEKDDAVDYLVVNDQLEVTYAAVRAILDAERFRLKRVDSDMLQTLCKI